MRAACVARLRGFSLTSFAAYNMFIEKNQYHYSVKNNFKLLKKPLPILVVSLLKSSVSLTVFVIP